MKQISLIGLSRAGKTCYTYAMAKVMRAGKNGITVFAPDRDMDEQLFAGWRRIRKEGFWPSGTDIVENGFRFQCQLFAKPVFDFWWKDYKGGALVGGDENDKQFRTEEFFDYVKASDGMIIFMASDMIMNILKQGEGWDLDFEDLQDLGRYLPQLGERIKDIPVTIAITKSDLLDNKSKAIVVEFVQHTIPSLFVEGSYINTLIAFVSLGTGLNGNQGETITGSVYSDPSQGNIHLPVLFNLYFDLENEITSAKQKLDELKNNLDIIQTGIITADNHTWFYNMLNGYDINELRKNGERIREAIENLEKKIQEAEKNIEVVRKEFVKDCQYYYNGKLQTL